MPRLLNLDGSAQTWAELHERNRVYWETHQRDGELKVVPRLRCTWCRRKRHYLCSEDQSGMDHRTVCECECRKVA